MMLNSFERGPERQEVSEVESQIKPFSQLKMDGNLAPIKKYEEYLENTFKQAVGKIESDNSNDFAPSKREGSDRTDASDTSEKKETDETDDAEKRQMQPPADVQFTCKDKYDRAEYERQVKNQETGMNNLSLYDYQNNREKYKETGRDTDVGGIAQDKVRQEARKDKITEYRREGMSGEEAEQKADEWIASQAALHDPDQIAGGNAENVTGMGDKEINSSIGSQWQYRIQTVDTAVNKYIKENGLSEEDMKNAYLNVKLEVISE